MRLRNARAAAAVFARLEQKLVAEDPNHHAGQSWVPWAVINVDDKDAGDHHVGPAEPPAAPAPSAGPVASTASVLLSSPISPLSACG